MPPANTLQTIVQPAAHGRPHSATLIFFHGLGDHADNLVQWLRYLLGRDLLHGNADLSHIRIIFPTAPRQRFTLFGGRPANVWYDVYGNEANPGLPERRSSFALIDQLVGEMIDGELALGIQRERIVVGGFSMGGYIAIHAALRIRPGLAGVFGLSTYLHFDTAVFDALERRSHEDDGAAETTAADGRSRTQLLMLHGDCDELLPHRWGRTAFAELRRLGVPGEFRTCVGMRHEMRAGELVQVERWLAQRLPRLADDVGCKL